ncbi:tetratricopeptide repeat protein [Sulfurimonas diazotrophicus]|uniref:Tetratricopeptide repeat protein n=1 Tax=Sulfurimonas diazotrophicus TaxID=3131939 RepID=A0ABZ3HAL0_9BACT
MLRYLLPCLAAGVLHAGVTDFHTLSNAASAYNGGDYAAAAEGYGMLQSKNDAARFNYGDALYKQQKYKEAADVFTQIRAPELKQKALHNLGNSLANLGKTDEAIKAYEEALKLGKDDDTQYNLDLLKKQKEQEQEQQKEDNQNNQNDQNQSKQNDQQQNKQKQQGDQQNKDQKSQDDASKGEDQQQKKDQQNGEQKEQEKQADGERDKQQESKEQSGKQDEKQQEAERQPEEAPESPETGKQQAAMADPISDMEERKYNQMLDKRGIKTLMIPLSGKGEPHDDETTPW